MGRTTQPLFLLVHPTLLGPETQKLAEQGHRIEAMGGQTTPALIDYDLILGPNCWRMLPALLKYLELAVKATKRQKSSRKRER